MSYVYNGFNKTDNEIFEFITELALNNPVFLEYENEEIILYETPVYISDFEYYKNKVVNISEELLKKILETIFHKDICKEIDLFSVKGYIFYEDFNLKE